MGVVYKATDLKLGRPVALKFLPPQWSHDETAKQRFLREAQAASATNHRNICIIHDIAQTDDGQLFIVMAYYEGETLKQKLEGGPLPAGEALEIAAEIAEGLAKAHAQGVVHRDVKPGNLMITDDGVKVLDFGLAKFADSLQLTMAGSTVGTVAYMSPEQARGEEADARSDVWALGVVLYEMLTGGVPFKGAYPEAMFHAIKNEPVPPFRFPGTGDREIRAAVEMLVLRALEKDPERRYQSAREVARDIRLLQGRTVPLDLRTEQLPPIPHGLRQGVGGQDAGLHGGLSWSRRMRRAVTPARAIAAVVALAAVVAGAYAWIARPVVRIPVAIAPVANHTGEPELDAYRLALTESLIEELRDSPNIRVVSYPRLLEIVRRFIGAESHDVSSSEAIQAIATQAGTRFLLLPSLEYRNGTWLGQVQVRRVETGTTIKTYETERSTSALPKDTASRLVLLLAEIVQAHFKANGSGRSYTRRPASTRFRNLDAARAFEEGLNAYAQLEYSAAADSFRRAVTFDDQHAMTHAWLSRIFLILKQGRDAVGSAQRAKQLMTAEMPKNDALFIDAILAESQADFAAAEARYRQLSTSRLDDSAALAELADFFRRQDFNPLAVEADLDALRLDAGYIRPHLDLCELYTRLTDHPLAETHAQAALAGYKTAGSPAGEAQARLCLGESQRKQTGKLADARSNIEGAREIFESLGQSYSLSRAYFYQGALEYSDGQFRKAVQYFAEAASRSHAVGNRLTESVALMNLGVTYRQLGQPAQAINYLRQSRDLFEQIGIERRAAEAEMNAAGLQVEFGIDQSEAIRRLANARATLKKLGYVDFEVDAMDLEAASQRHAGRLAEARRQLQAALSIAKEKQLSSQIGAIVIALAQTDLLLNDYEAARRSLEDVVARDAVGKNVEARITLATVYTRLGDFDTARRYLDRASANLEPSLAPIAHTALGELAYESGKFADARGHFDAASALWTADLPDAASVEARSYLALLDALARRGPADSKKAEASMQQARKMGRLELEARCRLNLARISLNERRPAEAIAVLNEVPLDDGRTLGPEILAELHYWRGRAMAERGDWSGAGSETAMARTLLQQLQASLPAAYRDRFAARSDIREMMAVNDAPSARR
jgi:tetratricopeptide (TPR) repeat protein